MDLTLIEIASAVGVGCVVIPALLDKRGHRTKAKPAGRSVRPQFAEEDDLRADRARVKEARKAKERPDRVARPAAAEAGARLDDDDLTAMPGGAPTRTTDGQKTKGGRAWSFPFIGRKPKTISVAAAATTEIVAPPIQASMAIAPATNESDAAEPRIDPIDADRPAAAPSRQAEPIAREKEQVTSESSEGDGLGNPLDDIVIPDVVTMPERSMPTEVRIEMQDDDDDDDDLTSGFTLRRSDDEERRRLWLEQAAQEAERQASENQDEEEIVDDENPMDEPFHGQSSEEDDVDLHDRDEAIDDEHDDLREDAPIKEEHVRAEPAASEVTRSYKWTEFLDPQSLGRAERENAIMLLRNMRHPNHLDILISAFQEEERDGLRPAVLEAIIHSYHREELADMYKFCIEFGSDDEKALATEALARIEAA